MNTTKLIFNKFKYSTLNTLNETKTNRKINPISRNLKQRKMSSSSSYVISKTIFTNNSVSFNNITKNNEIKVNCSPQLNNIMYYVNY